MAKTFLGTIKYDVYKGLLKFVSINLFYLWKTQKKRCPTCKSLQTIKWGIQQNKQRFKCKECGQLFTANNKSVSDLNKEICLMVYPYSENKFQVCFLLATVVFE